MQTIKLDNLHQIDVIANNEYVYRKDDFEFVNRLNQAIDYALEKLSADKFSRINR